jgi:hypothetical protein
MNSVPLHAPFLNIQSYRPFVYNVVYLSIVHFATGHGGCDVSMINILSFIIPYIALEVENIMTYSISQDVYANIAQRYY